MVPLFIVNFFLKNLQIPSELGTEVDLKNGSTFYRYLFSQISELLNYFLISLPLLPTTNIPTTMDESRTTSQSTATQDNSSDPVNKSLIPAIKDCSIAKEKEEVTSGGWKKQEVTSGGWKKQEGWYKDGRSKGGWATTWENRKNVPRGRTWAERFEDQRRYFPKGSLASNEETAAKE